MVFTKITMMMTEKYDPKKIEEPIYSFWERSGYFKPRIINNNIESYCIVMPPPNITGGLHLGHAFQQTIMDILIRYYRMCGRNTLWVTGCDHAGIATQILVENSIYNKIGKTRKEYSTSFLLDNIWLWKEKSEKLITYQMKRLGNSVDWDKQRFTMDLEMSFAVKEAFIRLYKKKFIYRGKRLVNWDYSLKTAISDLEVSHKQMQGSMWYIRYKFEDKFCSTICNSNIDNYLIIATTRPETIFGDVAIAVHPHDNRYNKLINKYVITPITNRRIPIISDMNVDMTKGTGCLKVTPAHDFNDYFIAKKHKLSIVNFFSFHGKILKKAELLNSQGKSINKSYYDIPEIFHGLNHYQARKAIILECDKINLLEKVEVHNLIIPFNSRTGTIIEPRLTDQWYIRMTGLSEQAIYVVKRNIIEFVPKQYKNMYFKWMENIQDWCISRQISWGHEIPAWYDDTNSVIYVGYCEQSVRIENKLNDDIVLRKEQDVLDTWFSSSLWTFSSLGWPTNNNLLGLFHPINLVVSGFDIIFFWIARMIMMTMFFIRDEGKNAQIPFKQVYITGLVRDEFGEKMSKSKGNIIDPLDIIDGISIKELLKKRLHEQSDAKLIDKISKSTMKKFPDGIKSYGSDSLRLTLSSLSSSGRDIYWDTNRLIGYHSFCNKLWNVSKFIFMHTVEQDFNVLTEEKWLFSMDRWIVTKLNQTIQDFRKSLENYRFDRIVNILYEFIWHQFCDWYIEFTKPILYQDKNILKLRNIRYTLITSLEIILRLAHPIIPFITEKIWQQVKTIMKIDGETIMLQSFPKYNPDVVDLKSVVDWEWVKNVISEIRILRFNAGILYNIPLKIAFQFISDDIKRLISESYSILIKIANLESIDFLEYNTVCLRSLMISLNKSKLLVFIPDCFNKVIAMKRFDKAIELINHKIYVAQQKLNSVKDNLNCIYSSVKQDEEKLSYYNKIRDQLVSQYVVIKML